MAVLTLAQRRAAASTLKARHLHPLLPPRPLLRAAPRPGTRGRAACCTARRRRRRHGSSGRSPAAACGRRQGERRGDAGVARWGQGPCTPAGAVTAHGWSAAPSWHPRPPCPGPHTSPACLTWQSPPVGKPLGTQRRRGSVAPASPLLSAARRAAPQSAPRPGPCWADGLRGQGSAARARGGCAAAMWQHAVLLQHSRGAAERCTQASQRPSANTKRRSHPQRPRTAPRSPAPSIVEIERGLY